MTDMDEIKRQVNKLAVFMQNRRWRLTVAESCTGGQLSAALTSMSGSSVWFDSGFVTYSNESKIALLGLEESLLVKAGAVSEETARAMAEGARLNRSVELSVSITGIAGPLGGTHEKPVGTVWMAWAFQQKPTESAHFLFKGERQAIQAQAVFHAISGLIHRFP